MRWTRDARVSDPPYIGRVWMNGDPWLVVDRALAERWTGYDGDYDRILEKRDVPGVILESDYDDGTVEVFRVAEDELLFVGIRYASGKNDWDALLREAVAAELEPEGRLEVETGEVAILAGAQPWSEATVVREQPGAPPKTYGAPNDEVLVVSLPPSAYALGAAEIDRETYGLAVWRLSRVTGSGSSPSAETR